MAQCWRASSRSLRADARAAARYAQLREVIKGLSLITEGTNLEQNVLAGQDAHRYNSLVAPAYHREDLLSILPADSASSDFPVAPASQIPPKERI